MESLLRLFGNTADACFAVNEKSQIIFWNAAAQRLFGLAEEDVLGRRCFEVVAGRDDSGRPICVPDCSLRGSAQRGQLVPSHEIWCRDRHGQRIPVSIGFVMVSGVGGMSGSWLIHYGRPVLEAEPADSPSDRALPPASREAADSELPAPTLTKREKQVLNMLTQGASTASVAQELSISRATARNHIQHLLEKLMVHSRLEAVTSARERLLPL